MFVNFRIHSQMHLILLLLHIHTFIWTIFLYAFHKGAGTDASQDEIWLKVNWVHKHFSCRSAGRCKSRGQGANKCGRYSSQKSSTAIFIRSYAICSAPSNLFW